MGKTFAAYSEIRTSNGLAHLLLKHSQRPLASYEISFIKLFCASLHDKRITSTHQISIPLRVRFFRKPLDCNIANIEFLPVGDATTTTLEPTSNHTASLEVDPATGNITVCEMNT